MSRTYHHNARRDLYIMVPETGFFACNWGALAKRFLKHHVRRLERSLHKRELRAALREADSLEVQFLSRRENVHGELLHDSRNKFCCCDACVREFEQASWNQYCEQRIACNCCGEYECEGTCPESFEAQDAYDYDAWEAREARERKLVPVKRAHEFDDDAVCVRCGFDGAEHWHWSHNTYEGVAAREAGEAGMPECKQVYWSYN